MFSNNIEGVCAALCSEYIKRQRISIKILKSYFQILFNIICICSIILKKIKQTNKLNFYFIIRVLAY